MSINVYAPLSTLAALQLGQQNVKSLTAQLQDVSQELSTGLRANVFADLGQNANFTLQLRSQMDVTEGFVTSNTLLGNKMQVVSTALGTVHDSAQSVLSAALSNMTSPGDTATTLQMQAKAALDQIASSLNTNFAGQFVFSGTTSNAPSVQSFTQASPSTGVSPAQVFANIIGGGLTSSADASAKIAQLDAAFNSTSGTASQNFEGTFYNGTPATDTSGSPNARQTAVIADQQTLSYGVQANDPEMRNVIQGLGMLASVDVSKISDPGAYQTWIQSAISKLSAGVDGVTQAQSELGSQQQQVADLVTSQSNMKNTLNTRVLDFESVDPYQAASQLQALQTQLQATYQATAQLGKLSILNYL